jgi:GH25 family lysozyme M1 (1,4-beta-N-acetylmuramidase)
MRVLTSEFLELADHIAAEPRARTTALPWHEALGKIQTAEALSLSPAEVFDGFVYSTGGAPTGHLRQAFEVIALPGEGLQQELREGDVLIRRGDGDAAYLSAVANPTLRNLEGVLSERMTPDVVSEGNYAQIVEAGPIRHQSTDRFARQLTDSAGRLLNDILLLRLAAPPPTVINVPQPAKPAAEPDESEAARPAPGFFSYEVEAPYTQAVGESGEDQPAGSSLSGLRGRIVEIAQREFERWAKGTKTETDPAMHDVLREYWQTVLSGAAVEQAIQQRSAWSAAFVSYVMRHAGAGDAFKYAAAHYVYVSAAKRSRQRSEPAKFWAFDISSAKPEPGDLVCRDRGANGGCGGTTLQNVDDGSSRPTHSDIVTEVKPDSITVIGGNVGGSGCAKGGGCTVNARRLRVDGSGFVIANQSTCRYYAIVKPPEAEGPTSSASSTTSGLLSLPKHLADAVRSGTIGLQVGLAILSGQRNETLLTNLVFSSRHPELPTGYKIQPRDDQFKSEWLEIRDRIIRPLLQAPAGDAPAIAAQPSAGQPPATVQGSVAPLILGLDAADADENHHADWAKAKAEGPIEFAIIRAHTGWRPDFVFSQEWPKIKDAGIVRGAYLFLSFPHPKYKNRAPNPAAQAQGFINKVGDLEPGDLPPTLDVEFPGSWSVTGMSHQQLLDGVRAAWKVLKERYGVAPIIYTSARVWREDLNDLAAPDLVESPLWLTPYPFGTKGIAVRDPSAFAPGGRYHPPRVPPPWGPGNWWIHQYQGDAHGLPGFRQVDMNRFNSMTAGETGTRVKWVQRRLGIAQTGTLDAATESALHQFQQTKNLSPSGQIDIRTFAFLCRSSSSLPDSSKAAAPAARQTLLRGAREEWSPARIHGLSGSGSEEQQAQINWCQMRQIIAAIARAEEARWTGPNGVKLLENDPAQFPILMQYWSVVPGFTQGNAAAVQAQLSANDQVGAEWSAAFICFVMHAAGIREAHGFNFSQRHMNYIVGALRNRERSQRDRPFWLVDHLELEHEVTPEPGDLVCFNRCVSRPNHNDQGCPPNHVWTRHTYESLRRQFWLGGNQNAPVTGSSHCSLVVGTTRQGGQDRLEMIGGNETNSVRRRTHIPINNGLILNPQDHHIFGMIKLTGC